MAAVSVWGSVSVSMQCVQFCTLLYNPILLASISVSASVNTFNSGTKMSDLVRFDTQVMDVGWSGLQGHFKYNTYQPLDNHQDRGPIPFPNTFSNVTHIWIIFTICMLEYTCKIYAIPIRPLLKQHQYEFYFVYIWEMYVTRPPPHPPAHQRKLPEFLFWIPTPLSQ